MKNKKLILVLILGLASSSICASTETVQQKKSWFQRAKAKVTKMSRDLKAYLNKQGKELVEADLFGMAEAQKRAEKQLFEAMEILLKSENKTTIPTEEIIAKIKEPLRREIALIRLTENIAARLKEIEKTQGKAEAENSDVIKQVSQEEWQKVLNEMRAGHF